MTFSPIFRAICATAVLAAITLAIASCGVAQNSTQKRILSLDKQAEEMKAQIRNTQSEIEDKNFSTFYYISSQGDDLSDGLSPDRAIKSLKRLAELDLKDNDCVLFRRGDLWRG